MAVAVKVAHASGRPVAVHAASDAGIRNAVEAGVDTIEHGLSLHRGRLVEKAEAEPAGAVRGRWRDEKHQHQSSGDQRGVLHAVTSTEVSLPGARVRSMH